MESTVAQNIIIYSLKMWVEEIELNALTVFTPSHTPLLHNQFILLKRLKTLCLLLDTDNQETTLNTEETELHD